MSSYSPPMISSQGGGHRTVETALVLTLIIVAIMAAGYWLTSHLPVASASGVPSVGVVNAAAAQTGLPVMTNTCNAGTTPFDYVACALTPR